MAGVVAEPALVGLGAGVHAWVQPDGTWWVNNAGLVCDDGAVLLVDTCATRRRTERFLAAVAGAAGAPVSRAVLTHRHGDHAFGAALLPEAATVIAHEATRDGLAAETLLADTPPVWSPVPDWGIDRVRLPDVAVRDVMMWVGRHRVEVRHPGYTAHTPGDLVVWLPDRDVLFAGDLLFHQVTPMMLAGSVDGARRALDWLDGFGARTVVPGHGPLIDGADLPEVLAGLDRYYRFLLDVAKAGLADGWSPLDAAAGCDAAEFDGWRDAERLIPNLHRAYADLTGTPPDVDAARADMLAWHGGPVACHA